ncbi:MAG: SIS domain-containing protein [Bacteroidota bacterium]
MEKIRSILQASINTKKHILADPDLLSQIEQTVQLITTAFQQQKRLYLCGNGGSAADAQHLAAEFSGRFYTDRKALPAEALHVNTSYLTAVANDYGYDRVYSRLVAGITQPGDVLIGISTSGNSVNVVNAFETARELGVITIGFTGKDGGKMKSLSNHWIGVPSNDTPRIQESHITIGHIICQLVEEAFFQANQSAK